MGQTYNTIWHFPIMILASCVLFYFIIWAVLRTHEYKNKFDSIILLSLLCVVFGMLFGKYGENWGFKWWIYYPVPLLINVILPPAILKMDLKKTIIYLILIFLSAPLIHVFFSFFFNWTEYMPFWEIPSIRTNIN